VAVVGLRAKRDPSFDPLRVPEDFAREFPDGDPSATEAVLNLTLTGALAINRVEELLAQYGLVLKGFNVLAVVSGAARPLTPTEIAERILVAKTTVTSVLDALERRQLLRRRVHPTNRRSVLIDVTEVGRSTCADILRRLHTLEASWMSAMRENDRQTLVRLLGTAKGLLSAADVPPMPQPDRGPHPPPSP
jgi:DNA-binding MarR family transcriptional regulator